MSTEAPDYADVDVDPRVAWGYHPKQHFFTVVPLPVDAICTGCKRTEVKALRVIDPRDTRGSFKDVCHKCQTVQWWNPIRRLPGAFSEETEARIERLDHLETRFEGVSR